MDDVERKPALGYTLPSQMGPRVFNKQVWCLSGWLSCIQHLVGGRRVLGGEAEQRLERGHRRASAVEPENELVDVVRQVFRAHAVVGSRQPGLEVREGPVDAREQPGGLLRIADRGRSMIVGGCAATRSLTSRRSTPCCRVAPRPRRTGPADAADRSSRTASRMRPEPRPRTSTTPTTIALLPSRWRPPRRPSSTPPT